MSERYNIDFEVGDFSEWDNTPATTTKLFVTAVSPITGSESASSGWKSAPDEVASNDLNSLSGLGNIFTVSMKIRNDSIGFGTSQLGVPFFDLGKAGNLVALLRLVKSGGNVVLRGEFGSDITGNVLAVGVTSPLIIEITRATSAVAANGIATLTQDGSPIGTVTNLSNFTKFSDAKTTAASFRLFSLNASAGSGHSGSLMVDDIVFSDLARTRLWKRDSAGVWLEISSGSWNDPVRAIYVKPGLDDDTIWAAVGAGIYRTDNGGTSWTLKATLTFEPEGIDGLPSDDSIIAYTKDAAGTNRFAIIADTTVTYRDSGHSTTGKGTIARGVA